MDSSRNFVLRIVDPATGRHAFLGMNFAERSVAFDFNVALNDFERRLLRDEELQRAMRSETVRGEGGGSDVQDTPAASLYRHEDLGLKEGETIRVSVGRKQAGREETQSHRTIPAVALTTPLGTLPPPPPPPPSSSSSRGSIAASQQQNNVQTKTTTVASSEAGWATF